MTRAAGARSRVGAHLAIVVLAPLLALLGACRGDHHDVTTADAAPSASPADTASALRPHVSTAHRVSVPHFHLPCRVLTASGGIQVIPASGSVTDGGAPPKSAAPAGSATAANQGADAGALAPGATIPDGALLVLAENAKLAVKSPHSLREVRFTGPATVRACVGDDDDAWVVRGTFTSVSGSGEGPGNEQWVATPLGVVRYAGGALTVHVDATSATATTTTGAQVYALAAPPAAASADAGTHGADGWVPVAKGHPWSVSGKADGVVPARAALGACREASANARSLAAAMSAPDADLATEAPAHIEARRAGRAACAVAELRIAALPATTPERAALVKTLTSVATWRALGPENPGK